MDCSDQGNEVEAGIRERVCHHISLNKRDGTFRAAAGRPGDGVAIDVNSNKPPDNVGPAGSQAGPGRIPRPGRVGNRAGLISLQSRNSEYCDSRDATPSQGIIAQINIGAAWQQTPPFAGSRGI